MLGKTLKTLAFVSLASTASAQDNAVTIKPDLFQISDEAILCQAGLERLKTEFGDVSEYDQVPLTQEEIAYEQERGFEMVAKYCGPMA